MKWYYYIITPAVALAGMSVVFPLDVPQDVVEVAKTVEELKKEKFDTILATSKIDTENKKGNLTRDELVELKSYAIVQKTKLGKFSNKKPVVDEVLGAIDTEPLYEVEIVELNQIDGGIAVFARAFRDGQQIGFGRDGTVDIERFRIFNPPVLVDDPNGDVVREWQEKDLVTGEVVTKTRTLREDPAQAILESLSHTVSTMKNVHDSSRIVEGKRGNTTSTFYPDANPESTSFDGAGASRDALTTFATARADTVGQYASDDRTTMTDAGHGVSVGLMRYGGGERRIVRAIALFDTSSIPDTDDIDSATISLYGHSKSITDSGAYDYICVVSHNPASNTAIANSDFPNRGSVKYNTSDLDISSTFSTTAYNDIGLNATGISAISKTGVSKFGFLIGGDFDNVDFSTTNNGHNYARWYASDQTGTTNDPKLVVVHSAGATTQQFNDIIYY